MPFLAWMLIAVGVGIVSGIETWVWMRHRTSALGVAAVWTTGIVVVLAIGAALVTGGSSSDAGSDDSSSADHCDPNYEGGCVPDTGGDVDCTEIADTNLTVVGDDVDGLDRDGDGIACES
jgi:hypothetical protein